MLLERPVDAPPLDPAPPVHRLAEGTELIGEYQGSGLQVPKFLIGRADGQVLQVPHLLYRVASSLDGRHDDAELAERLAAELDQELTAEQFSFLVEEKLRPAGVIDADDADTDTATGAGAPAERTPVKADPLLALRFRAGVVPQRVVWRLAGPLRFLFRRPIWIAVLITFVAVDSWVLFGGNLVDRSLAGVTQVIRHPWLVLVLLLVEILAATFHETGHVTACRYGGARPGDMGIGLYLVWPAFYSTVTDSYRLSRVGRLRTDLGGVYFNAIFMTALGAAYLQTGQPWLLVALLTWLFDTVWQFLPSIRLDGYYILADLTGVPELFGYLGPALKSLLPGRETHPRVRELRRWPRRVIVGWVAATIPTLGFYLVVFLLVLPHAVPVVVRELGGYVQMLEHAVRTGQVLQTTLGVLEAFFLILPWIGSVLITVTIAGRLRRAAVARWGRGRLRPGTWRRVLRGVAVTGVAATAALVVLRVWWVGTSLPPSSAEVALTNAAVAGTPVDLLRPGALLRLRLIVFVRARGAFGRRPDVLDGSRELAVMATAVLVGCLVVLARRRRVRLMAVALPLAVVLVMGPIVSSLAAVTGALVGSAWTAVGLLLLTRNRHRHRRTRGWVLTIVGCTAIAVGIVVSPIVAVPLAATAAVVLTGRGARSRGIGVEHRVLAVLLLCPAVLAAGYSAPVGSDPIAGPDRTVLLLSAALVIAAGSAIARLRPWAAAAAVAVLLAAVPWPGAGDALPLVVLTSVPLAVLVIHALVGVPVAERPHPLLRAALAVPFLLVTVVGGLFAPPEAAPLPHAALASWLTGPSAPAAPVVVPAELWGDLVHDGVPPDRVHVLPPAQEAAAGWVVTIGDVPKDSRTSAQFGDGDDRLTVQGP